MSERDAPRVPWLGLVDLPNPEAIDRQMRYLSRWLEERPDEHPERRAIVQTLHAELDRVRRELESARWILDQAVNFVPMETDE